ncbi:CYTH domain-containing protein [Priestia megaterium]|nr:CYTH domain-containing protein [Priestia megaterium]
MKQELEIEFKNLVTQDEFQQLINHFKITNQHFISQENHYFDTPDFQLKEKGAALRIRQKNQRSVLTLKQPHDDGLLETHAVLTTEQAGQLLNNNGSIPNDMAALLQSLGITSDTLVYFGTLKTDRAEIAYKNGLLVFDHSFYLDIDDYEVEYEVQDAKQGLDNFRQLLKDFQIPARKTDNKIRRFYQQKYHLLSED